MKKIITLPLVIAGIIMLGSSALANCGINSGKISVLANDFPALHAVVSTAEECAGGGVTFSKNHTAKHNEISVPALTANPAQYSVKIVANSSIVPLLNNDLIRPLNDLVAKYGQHLKKNQLITVDGKIMAIAFMANAQHLFVRKDILDQVGHDIPKTYEEVLAACKAIRDAGIMQYPFAMLSKPDWNLGEEFVNMYLGHGGVFFKPGTAEPAVNNKKGVATLKMLKALTSYSNPDFLTFNSATVAPIWEAGNLALAELWGSTGGQILDAKGSTEKITSNTLLVSAPRVGGGNTPASSLWWDGFTIARNISEKDAEASFRAMLHGISDEMVKKNNDKSVWLIDAYVPGKAAAGVFATASGGSQPYPMLPYMGILHMAFSKELPDYLQGNESAKQTLADIEAAYISGAKEKGFL